MVILRGIIDYDPYFQHSFKNQTGDRTSEALDSRFAGPTVGSLGSIAGPVIKN
jgi:hypothetical protein